MGWTVTTAPTSEPLTLAEAKKQCEIATAVTEHDTFITTQIVAARQYVERKLGIGIMTQTVTHYWDGFPQSTRHEKWPVIRLTPGQVQSVTSLKYIDVDGIEQQLTPSTKASGTLTFTGLPSDTETITINATVYTFQTTLTDTAGNVLIGADATECARNLTAAINLSTGAGVYYAASTVVNPDVRATYLAGVVTVTAILATTAPNAYATTETATNTAWTAATLGGGTGDGVDYKVSLTKIPAQIAPAYDTSWPSTRNEMDSVYAVYVRGWASAALVPSQLKQAMLMMIDTWFECRNDKVRRFPTAADMLIDQYREIYL